MASDMTGLLAPPSRTTALARAHTDPTSSCYENQPTPNSPPPTYEEVMKEVLKKCDFFRVVYEVVKSHLGVLLDSKSERASLEQIFVFPASSGPSIL